MPLTPLALSIIASSAVGVLLLFVAAGRALAYTQTFYGDRPVPRSWLFIVVGLMANALAEAGELGVFTKVALSGLPPGIPEGVFELACHAVAGIMLAVGAYMLWKEIP